MKGSEWRGGPDKTSLPLGMPSIGTLVFRILAAASIIAIAVLSTPAYLQSAGEANTREVL